MSGLFALILVFTMSLGEDHFDVTVIDGFTSKQLCDAAGQMTKERFQKSGFMNTVSVEYACVEK